MELTPDKVKDLLNTLLLQAKENRAAIPYSRTDGFPQCVMLLGPNLQPMPMPITWKTEPEKYRKMAAVSKMANDLLCQAVVLISDTRWVEEERVVKILGLPPSSEVGFDTFCANYKRVVMEKFGGYLGNAPKELFSEAIVVVMKGPRLNGPQTLAAAYEEGPNDSIRWLKIPVITQTVHFNLLPDWWQ